MSKVSKTKINLASGSVMEKPLVTCFKGTNGNYIVLDNETNNPIGLPIICVSKFTGTSCEKIIDPAEWSSVKENLKTIISGTALPYLSVPESLTAQDDFFTQLTLPVASFDVLKNAYVVPVSETPADPVVETPVATPEMPVAPEAQPVPVVVAPDPISVAPVIEPAVVPNPVIEASVDPIVETRAAIDTPIIAPITVDTEPPAVTPVIPEPVAPVVEASVAPAAPAAQPAVEGIEDINALKENFMKSCENMFDALVKKFQK